ncbi:hypothetical protein [Thiofilum flexile]|uniref:hypothetical protein n=1 Tax=Thiofilum flexile TaxID=125627 RepID=UPI00035C8A1E|nr:hypothetical protein [Thiofilum flexile]
MATESTTKALDGEIHRYPNFLHAIQKTFKTAAQERLFITDAPELWPLFLNNLPEDVRQKYTCSACRQFMKQFGSLVRIEKNGSVTSALWAPKAVPAFFQPAVEALQQAVEQAPIKGLFVSSLTVYGKPYTGSWRHMAITPPADKVWQSPLLDAGQYRAQKLEAFKMLSRALNEFSAETVDTAVRLLRSDQLYRSEKVLGMAEWLKALYADLNATPHLQLKAHKKWLAVANAPEGFCHVRRRSSMIGSLLEDIELGVEYEKIRMRFAEKTHPLQYQLPQIPPSTESIKQAEKILEAVQAADALERRYARLDEVPLFWQPQASHRKKAAKSKTANSEAFGHLAPKFKAAKTRLPIPSQTLTWGKFERNVLPDALKIEVLVPKDKYLSICALTTAANDDAPPILQWDHVKRRNPFAIYMYHGGSLAHDWYLSGGYVEITGLCLNPPHWRREQNHHPKSAVLFLKNARDRRHQTAGLALFPETLKSKFHPIRKTIEAFSKTGRLQGFAESSACGLFLSSNSVLNHQLRVTTELGVQTYVIDRWD